MQTHQTKIKSGFSFIEVLVVFAISALAISIFAPMLVDARRQTRLAVCANNLRQLGQAIQDHEQSLGHFPSSGWGWRWTGDPDRGFGRNQPGGWVYNAVRFTGYNDVASQGAGLPDRDKGQHMLRAHGTPIEFFNCPARRPVQTYPVVRNGDIANNLRECKAGSCEVVRIDYQANSGNIAAGETVGPNGGRSLSAVPRAYTSNWNGITSHVSMIRRSQIEDGLSKTLCLGEKYLNPDQYMNGLAPADDLSAYCGIDRDVNGYTASATRGIRPRAAVEYLPRRDKMGLGLNWSFGSAHESGMNAVNCDNSLRFISYNIDYVVYSRLGGRNDGPLLPTSSSK